MLKELVPSAGEVLSWIAARARLKEPTFRPEGAALLVLDLQRTFTEPRSHAFVPSAPEVIGRANALARAFKERGLPVIYTLHLEANPAARRWWRSAIEEDELDPRLELLGPVVVKGAYDPFLGTELTRLLAGAEGLVIAGVMTHICVLAAALSGFSRGFGIVIPVDAVASYNRELHLAALLTLAHSSANLMSTEEVLGWLGSG